MMTIRIYLQSLIRFWLEMRNIFVNRCINLSQRHVRCFSGGGEAEVGESVTGCESPVRRDRGRGPFHRHDRGSPHRLRVTRPARPRQAASPRFGAVEDRLHVRGPFGSYVHPAPGGLLFVDLGAVGTKGLTGVR